VLLVLLVLLVLTLLLQFDIQSLTVGIRARKGTNSMIFRSPVTHGPEFVGTKFMLPEWEFITLVPFVRIQYSKLFGKALAKTEAKLERKKKEESARESAQLDARAARKSEHIANDPMLKAQGSFENPLGGAVQDDLAVVKVKKKRKWKKSLFTFNLPISRRDGYYLVNVVPLNCLIVLLGWTAFAMEPDVIDQRLTVVFTMLLTSTAFKFVYADSLPRIDYVTLLDAYMYSALVMLLLQAIEHVYAIHQIVPFHDGNSNTTWAEHKKSMDDLIIQERVILGCLIATWTSIHLFIAWHVISHRKFQKPYSFPNQGEPTAACSTAALYLLNGCTVPAQRLTAPCSCHPQSRSGETCRRRSRSCRTARRACRCSTTSAMRRSPSGETTTGAARSRPASARATATPRTQTPSARAPSLTEERAVTPMTRRPTSRVTATRAGPASAAASG